MENRQRSNAHSEDADLKLPTGNSLVVELARGHGLYKIGFSNGQGSLPEAYSGRYTKPDLAFEDARKLAKEFWDVYSEFTQESELKKQPPHHAIIYDTVEQVQPKKRGRKPKVKTELQSTEL